SDPWATCPYPVHHDGSAAACAALSVTTRPKRRAFFFNASTVRACCAASYSAADTWAGNTPDFSVWYSSRATLCAAAVTAFSAPRHAFRRRKKEPSAERFCHRLLAARHNACAARPRPRRVRADLIFFLPDLVRPDCLTTGHRPSQAP